MTLTRCGQCGANLAPEDMIQPGCRYCGTVLPHHARAAQQAQLVTNLMADKNGNGIPDAFEGLVAGSVAQAGHVVGYQANVIAGAGQPGALTSHVMQGSGAPLPGYGVPHGALHAQLRMQQHIVKHAMRGVWLAVGISLAVGVAITGAIIVLVLL